MKFKWNFGDVSKQSTFRLSNSYNIPNCLLQNGQAITPAPAEAVPSQAGAGHLFLFNRKFSSFRRSTLIWYSSSCGHGFSASTFALASWSCRRAIYSTYFVQINLRYIQANHPRATGSLLPAPYASPESSPAQFSAGFPSQQDRDLRDSPAADIRSGWKRWSPAVSCRQCILSAHALHQW